MRECLNAKMIECENGKLIYISGSSYTNLQENSTYVELYNMC